MLLKHKYFQNYYAIILEINFLGEIQSYSAIIWGIKISWLDDYCIQAIWQTYFPCDYIINLI